MKYDYCLRKMLPLLFCLFLVDKSGAQNCGEFNDNQISPISVPTKYARQGAWPWMVEIDRRDRGGTYINFCSATMITSRHVLSAAHCFSRRDPSLYLARIGHVDLKKADEYTISQIMIPDSFNLQDYYDDIAVLTLSRDVSIENFSPICLPESAEYVNLTGQGTTFAGWESSSPDDSRSEKLIQVPGVPVISNSECNALYDSRLPSSRRQLTEGITDGFLCAGSLETSLDTCKVETGGPLMFLNRNRWYVVGMASFTVEKVDCQKTGLPEGFTRVTEYLDWILEKIKS